MKNTRLLFVIWMLFLVLPQGYSQGKKEDSSVLGQVNGFLSKHVKLTAYGQFGYSYTDRKDWLSGNFWLLSFKISYLCLPLFYETRTTPSCHPSGCAYRQL